MGTRAIGLRLYSDDRDVVALNRLAALSSSALTARYRVVRRAADSVLCGDTFDSVTVALLKEAGADLVELDVDVDVAAGAGIVVADGLLAAVPARPHVEVAVPDEVLFVIASGADGTAATALLLEQLALLDRHDARVGRLADGRVTVRVAAPPWWLFSRVVDGAVADVSVLLSTSTAALTPAPLYVEHSRRQPLAKTLAQALRAAGQVGLLWTSGTLLRISGPWDERPLDDALQPVLPPASTTTTTTSSALTERFSVSLRLGTADAGDDEPELFVLPSTSLTRLQAFVESAAPDELERVLISRVSDAAGRAVYVVRELVRPGVSRLGARLQTLLSSSGYARVVGIEGLFLPLGKRLVPVLRAPALRQLLGLGVDDPAAAGVVIVDADSDGLRLTQVLQLDLAPLSSLTSFVLTDRRTVYDRLLEELVLAWPGVQLARPDRPERAPVVRVAPLPLVTPRAAVMPSPPVVAAVVDDTPADVAALQREEQTLQAHAIDAADDVDAWSRLTMVKAALHADDVIETAAAALFLQSMPTTATVQALQSVLPTSRSLLELATSDNLGHVDAVALCVQVLQLVAQRDAGSRGALDDDLLHQATRLLLRDGVPIPRRLQWVTLLAVARHLHDPIGLTRAKEAVLGALNTRGLTEALDLPRFVRTTLALSGVDAAASSPLRARSEQLVVVEDALSRLVPEPLQMGSSTDALLTMIFANGLARLGGAARPLIAGVEAALPAHDGPVQALLRLHIARIGFVVTRDVVDSDDARALWKQEVQQTFALVRPEDRRAAEWLVKRSSWLRVDVSADAAPGLRPSLTRRLDDLAAADPATVDVAAAIVSAREVTASYDFEVTATVEAMLKIALRTGRDDVIEAAAAEAIVTASSVRILAHRARLLGVCVRAAATVQATPLVERCLDAVAAMAGDKNVPGVRDLLLAIRPALLALRRFGASDAARRFIAAFVPLTQHSGRETGPLAAALAEGSLQLGDAELADTLLQRALQPVWLPTTPHIDRYEAGAAALSALSHWPHGERFRHAERFVAELSSFTDTFTTSRWFATHQLLIAERLVDCLVDDTTVRSDTLQAWLDNDEARVRRRVLSDWRSLLT